MGAAETAPKSDRRQKKQAVQKKETEVSLRFSNFVLLMYHHLTSLQRSQIFAYKQCDKSPKFIAEALNYKIPQNGVIFER